MRNEYVFTLALLIFNNDRGVLLCIIIQPFTIFKRFPESKKQVHASIQDFAIIRLVSMATEVELSTVEG